MSDAPPIIYPWEGTGWPIEIFKEPDIEMIRKHYLCTRNECGNVLRNPIELECGDRVCKDCYNMLLQIAAPQRICHACEGEIHNANTNTPINPFLEIPPKRIKQTIAQTEDFGHQEMELGATSSQAVQRSGDLKLEESAWIVPEKCGPDKAAAGEINKLEVKCPSGCNTDRVGTRSLCIRTLKRHMKECSQRLIACEYCTDRVRKSDLESHLSLECNFRVIDCTNGCRKRGIQSKDLAEHYLVCPRRTSAAVSCTQDTNLPFILDTVTRLGDEVKEVKEKVEEVSDKNKQLEGELKETKSELKETRDEVTRNELIIDAYTERKKFGAESGTASGSLVDIQYRYSIEDIDFLAAKSKYQKENGKGILILGLAGADLQTCSGGDWKFSIPCCVKSSGLTFRVGVKPYGYGQAENSYMSVCFVRMNGGDELDTQPEFNLQLTLALRNLETNKHIIKTFSPMVFTKPTDDQHIAYGCLKFVPRQKLETGNGYVKADMLVLQISVREIQGRIAQAL